ncbi:hypothetical protein LCGC14_1070850 [marine sediment metagenome]|uniref:Uncharacterized protein n=1 Tax=marine sediment metagenome TaxID=412755 RepID=A0A0F9MID1_9ZZZZ
MSTALFQPGDHQRLDRERTLTEQAPRQLPEEDRSPNEEFADEPNFGLMLEALMMALQQRGLQ